MRCHIDKLSSARSERKGGGLKVSKSSTVQSNVIHQITEDTYEEDCRARREEINVIKKKTVFDYIKTPCQLVVTATNALHKRTRFKA